LVLALCSAGVVSACGTTETTLQDEEEPGAGGAGGGAGGSTDTGSPDTGGGSGGGGSEPGGGGGGGGSEPGGGGTDAGTTPGGPDVEFPDPGEEDGGPREPVGPCGSPNPQGCSSDADCADGEACQVSDTLECIPSSCFCDEESGGWACTRDCGNMRCMPAGDPVECDDDTGCEPVICPAIYAPVCGVDGITYGNACEAAAARMDVAYDGECGDASCAAIICPEGTTCENGACVDGSCAAVTCAEGFSCENGECVDGSCAAVTCMVGSICRNGECIEDPCNLMDCAEGFTCEAGECVELDPCATIRCRAGYVCEDGDCVATEVDPCTWIRCAAGQVCEAGACIDEDTSCAAILCGPGSVCERGECVAERDCTINCFVPDPVCGENGVTYWCGEVEASCNEVMVAYDGECSGGGGTCTSSSECIPGELCVAGQCEPGACPMIYQPVCGSDGRTYGNACLANLARVEIVAEGACEGADR
jgi:hypothetical protein